MAPPARRSAPEPERQLVVFTLHGEQYALPIGAVQEISRYTPPTATALASGMIKGMISWRGQVLPIVDLSDRLGRTLEITEKTQLLVLELTRGTLGLIVDRVEQILTIPSERIGPLPTGENDLGAEIAAVDDRLIMVLDPDQALGSALAAAKPAPRTRRRAGPKNTGSRPPAQ
jgi:purine-binding chemotaxis protein CheW